MGLAAMPSPSPPLPADGRAFRNALSHYPTGVCAITGSDAANVPVAMVVGTFTSVSLDPPLVGFLPAKSSETWPILRRSGRFCANILTDTQGALCKQMSSKTGDRFAGLSWRPSAQGNAILEGVAGWFDCSIHSITDAGDHEFVLGLVREMAVVNDAKPLLFHCGSFGSLA